MPLGPRNNPRGSTHSCFIYGASRRGIGSGRGPTLPTETHALNSGAHWRPGLGAHFNTSPRRAHRVLGTHPSFRHMEARDKTTKTSTCLDICEGNWKSADGDPAEALELVMQEVSKGFVDIWPSSLDDAKRKWTHIAVGKLGVRRIPGKKTGIGDGLDSPWGQPWREH